jgi:hypothetical protein
MAQILVKVRDISTDDHGQPTELNGNERVITLKHFQYKRDAYELIAQVKENGTDENGNTIYEEVPGNPNLEPQYRTQVLQKSAEHAASPVVNPNPVILPAQEVAKAQTEQVQKRKPGPKPKQLQEQTA